MKKRSLFGWLAMLSGIGMIALSVVAFAAPEGKFTYLYAITALLAGITDLVFYINGERYTGAGPIASLLCGVFGIMVGAVLLAYSDPSQHLEIGILLSLWIGSHSVFRLVNLKTQKKVAGCMSHYISLAISILGLLIVAVLLIYPAFFVNISLAWGIYLLCAGVDSFLMGLSKLGSRR